jgi:hypothetical protein
MRQAAGTGSSSFTYAFAHNGSLPGFAQFAISTNINADTKVNVYKFEADVKRFFLVAGGVQVAENGIVTYMNNTTSEYLITTATLNDAILTDAYTKYNNAGGQSNSWLTFLIIGIAILGIGSIMLLIFIKRKGKKMVT